MVTTAAIPFATTALHRATLAFCCAACLLLTVRADQVDPQPSSKCLKWDGRACDPSDVADPRFHQIVVLSAGYSEDSAERFWSGFDTLIDRLSGEAAGRAWSAQKRDRLLYVGYFTSGGALNSESAAFGARIIQDPSGVPTLAVDAEAVHRFVDMEQSQRAWLRPLGVAVLIQSEDAASANATPPSFTSRPYGIALFTSSQIEPETPGAYVAAHELGHAALNFLDEYVEPGLEEQSIAALDALGSRLIPRGAQTPTPGIRLSEVLAGNGPINVALQPIASAVRTPGEKRERYDYEGGLFFGRGTYHDAGRNLMNLDGAVPRARDGFAFDHSPSQQDFIDAVFGDAPPRPNDRLRNAGPADGFLVNGPTVDLLLYDGDKRNSFHRTDHYVVQVGWYEADRRGVRQWKMDEYRVFPTERIAELALRGDRPEEHLLLTTMCRAGMTERSTSFNGWNVCDRENAAFLPTLTFEIPYEEVTVPVRQPSTKYWWRFRTWNGAVASGWTGWSSFYRSF